MIENSLALVLRYCVTAYEYLDPDRIGVYPLFVYDRTLVDIRSSGVCADSAIGAGVSVLGSYWVGATSIGAGSAL
jgi:hypothetical protein